jgi:ribonucleoside-diphosphate reductase alpha chain
MSVDFSPAAKAVTYTPALDREIPDTYQTIIFKTRYARWEPDKKRRETWGETIHRYCTDMFTRSAVRGYVIPQPMQQRIHDALINMDVQPSMRTLMTAGKALKSAELANFNCTATGIASIDDIGDIAHILMCGSGVGFSVERHFISQLPLVERHNDEQITLVVDDSRAGWSNFIKRMLKQLFRGATVTADISQLREKGARLETFGGYSSGGMVLFDACEKINSIFNEARVNLQERLSSVQVSDIVLMLADCIVSGGVRRSATIILFDKDDDGMINYKNYTSGVEMYRQDASGAWVPGRHAHRQLANISAVVDTWRDRDEFNYVWNRMIASGAGEPGFINRSAFHRTAEKIGRKTHDVDGNPIKWLTNPCAEIQLQPRQACNLTAVTLRATDKLEDLVRKIQIATVLGTIQASVTNFEHVDPRWKETVEEEALLGVCLTGIFDHPILSTTSEWSGELLQHMKEWARETNRVWSALLNINPSAAITSVKPSGNSSQLYDTASGIHPRYSEHYIRRVRQSGGDPMAAFLTAQGVHTEVSKQNSADTIFSFVRKAPEGVKTAHSVSALEQAELWLHYKRHYVEHTVSCTISYRKEEIDGLADWVYNHYDEITGLSFLPITDHVYEQAPYEAIDIAKYAKFKALEVSTIDWTKLAAYEITDTTTVGHELACTAAGCETL